MSWFDTTGIAILAKNALKEAQKQIDKALDIKDDEESSSAAPACDGTIEPKRSTSPKVSSKAAPDAPMAGVGEMEKATGLSAVPTQFSSPPGDANSMWGSFTGSFFEPMLSIGGASGGCNNTATVTKPPASLKRKSFEDSGSSELPKMSFKEDADRLQPQFMSTILSPVDSSESIEVLSSATTPGSVLTSPSQLSVNAMQEVSESVEVLATLGSMSTVSTPDSNHANDRSDSFEPDALESRRYTVSTGKDIWHDGNDNSDPKDGVKEDDEVSVEDDSLSYTLSEQPVTVMEASGSTPPITVAPSRNSLHLPVPLSTATVGAIVKDAKDVRAFTHPFSTQKLTISEVSTVESEETNDSKTALEPAVHERSQQQQSQLDEPDQLELSYENVEIQTEISDSTQSFEEITTGAGGSSGDGELLSAVAIAAGVKADPKISNASGKDTTVVLHGSSPNSGDDEIETATSSDIEIISSPNGGDSSSTNSGVYRTSPLKISDGKTDIDILLIKKQRGHTREPSEVSVHSGNSDESHLPEVERLLRRIVDLSELLEQREYRLVELGRQHAELHEQNAQLLAQQESRAKRTADGGSETDGYTQRLFALERKFQQSIREKETLKRQYESLRAESQGRVLRCEMEKALADRDFMISELQKEGESLSKQVLQHSNIIKRLRIKERENDVQMRKQREEIAELTEEAERLKRSLSAKEEVERSQIDAVHKLSSEKRKLERDCVTLKSQLDDHVQKLETLRKSFDFARKELSEQSESYQGLLRQSTKLQSVENEYGAVQRLNEQLTGQLEELREQLRRSEHDYGQRLMRAKNEYTALLQRLEAAEMRAEEEKNASALVTVPLMRQLESLQHTMRQKERLSEQRDTEIAQQLAEATDRVKGHADQACKLRDQVASLQSRIVNLEERLKEALSHAEEMTNGLQQKQLDAGLLERNFRQRLAAIEEERRVLVERLAAQERCHAVKLESLLNNQMQSHGPLPDASLVLQAAHQEQIQQQQPQPQQQQQQHGQPRLTSVVTRAKPIKTVEPLIDSSSMINDSRHSDSSPTPSMGNLSLPESLASIPWIVPDDEAGRAVGGSAVLLSNTSLLETLQASLKQRDGEVYQLQWELSRFQQERNVLNTEISNLTMEIESIRESFERSLQLQEEHGELKKRYDALLQMYGESVEKTEELRLDLVDVKDMYKLQIDDLLRQQRELMASINRATNIVRETIPDSRADPAS
ncbi:TATA element modulatory factor [Anopheles bellator]|uniref:TATA element modulatory factor n=1 Tax=Anopheles bellator TaxID=139047 RepID=UPI002647A246|nr:TATA element modulatory factor [Anopheles bellator]